MFDYQFFLQDLHFTLSLLSALVFFAVFWLYFDAWMQRKTLKEGLKIVGLLLLSISYVIHATIVEDTVLQNTFIGSISQHVPVFWFQLIGFASLIAGLLADPLQKRPDTKPMALEQHVQPSMTSTPNPTQSLPVIMTLSASASLVLLQLLLLPVLCIVVGVLYLVRATIGLERHLKQVGIAFLVLSFSYLAQALYVLRDSSNVYIYQLVAPFGVIWIGEHVLLFVAVCILGNWVFRYLLKRIQSQLFMIMMMIIVAIFLVTTISFTILLTNNLRLGALSHLQTDSNVLKFALSSKKNETLSDAQLVAQNPQVINDIVNGNKHDIRQLATDILVAKNEDFLIIATQSGSVIARGEDPTHTGDSFSSDSLVKRALSGQEASSIIVKDGVLAPAVSIRSAEPIYFKKDIIGVVLVGSLLDNAFVDGVKDATNLDVSVYGGNVRSATTFISSDGKSRDIGVKELTPAIDKSVLIEKQIYLGSVTVLNTPYYAAFLPLLNVDANPVGMLFVGEPQVSVLQTAASAIGYTFVVTVILLLLSIIPAYIISNYISRQLR